MKEVSQNNLIKLADEALTKNKLNQAQSYLLEALRLGHKWEIVEKLCNIFLQKKEPFQAYRLIKEEPDLFSNQKIYDLYVKILQKCHFYIEARELSNLAGLSISEKVKPVSMPEQQKIIKNFRTIAKPTEKEYLELYKLDMENFVNFAQSLLLDPTLDFAIRLSLCEDLVKLGYDKEMSVLVLGKKEGFIPKETSLFEKDTLYHEVVMSIADYYQKDPTKLLMMLNEAKIAMGMLYPKLHTYISNPDAFAHDLRTYIEKKDGGENKELLGKIYSYLNYEKN
ncbi:hypothetical protein FP435_02900 [Lactobacillus sp. PV037]|uniref:hypothetical protein n=1 Tax=unclassified Lactobacillus TaxID=2620435 RepID=UPI00223E93F8|nr:MULTISPECIES: hypothetical protein [unclassified Lactobacillus]QNQ82427.1 hypothetical protein FP433_04925 [Lactobacillus sp. PV012]QNQ83460.1 hypothetical protein FP435_02900 [Lactobacillus sp. PV037]